MGQAQEPTVTSDVPSVLSILICDYVILEAGTNKKTLVGVFDSVNTTQLPVFQRLGFYARLTDMWGKYRFKIRIVVLDEEEQLIGGLETNEIEATDRLAIMELALNLPPVPLTKT